MTSQSITKKNTRNYRHSKGKSKSDSKDAVLVNEWILTSNQEFFEGMSEQETRKFFQDTLEYFSENLVLKTWRMHKFI